ncbi:MAG: efflux RND transporter permease subunit, partial [Clostridia bacterium]|nr:efflux RND transporter permease subunit [Clostridia bacterium]
MKLYELSVKRPVAVTMAVLIFIVLGIYSLSMLPIEMMPDMELSMAVVYTSYSNVGSEEVENLVTKNIESAITSVSGVDTITSNSSEGTSMILVQFVNGTDMDKAIRSMEDNIDLISGYLPDGTNDPMIIRMDTSMMPAAMMSVSYEGYNLTQTKKFLDENVVNKLESVEGVASINVTGASDRQIEVIIDPQKMFGYNLSLSDIATAISYQNQNLPAGSTEGMEKKLPVKTEGKFKSINDIEYVPLMTSTGQIIYLRDIASVKDSYSGASSY